MIVSEHAIPKPPRLLSLDAFRGLVIATMFLVNVAGSDPAFPAWFPHRGWNAGQMGNGLADFVFPCFLFIVGVAIPFSLRAGKALSPLQRLTRTVLRSVRLYLLGTLLIAASMAYERPIDWRIVLRWDILPMIAFASLTATLLTMAGRWALIGFVLGALAFKWLILTQLSLPGKDVVIWTATESYQAYLRSTFGWWGVALTQGFAASATAALGVLVGTALESGRQNIEGEASTRGARLSMRLVIAGAVMVVVSYVWHRWGGLPYSKDFFTSSFILVNAGVGTILIGGMHWVIDVKKWTTMLPLRQMGMNALALYVLAEFLWRTVLMQWQVVTPRGDGALMITALKAWLVWWTNPTVGPWILVLSYVGFYWAVSAAMYRRNLFIRV